MPVRQFWCVKQALCFVTFTSSLMPRKHIADWKVADERFVFNYEGSLVMTRRDARATQYNGVEVRQWLGKGR